MEKGLRPAHLSPSAWCTPQHPLGVAPMPPWPGLCPGESVSLNRTTPSGFLTPKSFIMGTQDLNHHPGHSRVPVCAAPVMTITLLPADEAPPRLGRHTQSQESCETTAGRGSATCSPGPGPALRFDQQPVCAEHSGGPGGSPGDR